MERKVFNIEISGKPHRCEVVVDFGQIMRQLAPRAAVNKTGRARFLEGAVIVEVEPA